MIVHEGLAAPFGKLPLAPDQIYGAIFEKHGSAPLPALVATSGAVALLPEAAGLTADREILVYCGTSREGSLLRFYLRHVAKYPNVRLYEGSWKEYASMKQHPAETKENKPQ